MDLDKSLIDLIVVGGKLEPLIQAGLQTEDFEGVYQKMAAYIFDTFRNPRYKGKLPTAEMMKRRFPDYRLQRHKEPVAYLVDQLRDRSDYNFMSEQLARVGGALKKNDLAAARQSFQTAGLQMAARSARVVTTSLTRNMAERKERYEQLRDGKSTYGIPTGFAFLDELTLGWQPGDFAYVLAKRGIAKTWILLICGYAAQCAGTGVLFVSREMSVRSLEKRYDALHAKIPYQAMRKAQLGNQLEKHYFKKLLELKNFANFEVPEFEGPCTVSAIRAKARELGCRMVIIDGIYMLDDEEGVKTGWEKHFNIAKQVAYGLCKADQRSVLASNQLNREADQWDATLDNGAFGDAYGMFCSVAFKLMRGADERVAKQLKVQMLKMREEDCPPRPQRLTWDFERMVFQSEGQESEEEDSEETVVDPNLQYE
jgi:hypothetical protein